MATLNNPIFPVHNDTFVGIATDEEPGNYGALHCEEPGTLTIVTPNGSTKVLLVAGGDDINVAGCLSVTSTARVWIS